ncbi:MAG TPA: hypothetical protein VKD04_09605 [Burkholderiales bacterium]|nr:hypothetical protein [Burkholderiales bacterium]
MDIERKLEELKAMREKGLITASVYDAQQQALLSGHSADSTLHNSNEQKETKTSFLDPAKNFRILVKLGIFVGVVLVGIWLVYQLSGKDGKDTLPFFQTWAASVVDR